MAKNEKEKFRKCVVCKIKPASPRYSKCHSCIKRKSIERDPVRYCFINLKANAKKRGKEFTLTLEFFRQFCRATNYIQNKGTTSESYSIDRIDNEKGYTPDNIRILTLSDNSKKHTKKLVFDWERTKDFTVISLSPIPDSEQIFYHLANL